MGARSWSRLRLEAIDSVRVLLSLLESEPSQARLIEGYLESKRALAEAFQALVRERIASRVTLLDDVKSSLEAKMQERFSRLIPDRYLHVRGYGSTHRQLYAYLTLFIEEPVPASALRIITADAVHTERRARELRDLGLDLDATTSAGSDVYVLHSADPDLDEGSLRLTGLSIKADKTIDPEARQQYLDLIGWREA